MRKILYAIVVWHIAVSVANARMTINAEAVKKSIVFIYAARPDGTVDKDRPLGTGFFVGVPPLTEPNPGYVLLVTARHVVDPQWACLPGALGDLVYLRLNKQGYDPEKDDDGLIYKPQPLKGRGKPTWFRNKRDDVDVAVIPIDWRSFANCDWGLIRLSDFPTPEETKNLSIGDDVVSAGLIPAYSGRKRNYPYFKFGKVSNIPEEAFEQACPSGGVRPLQLWFVAANLVPGNSGSPIFYQPPGSGGTLIGALVNRPVLLGVQSIGFTQRGNSPGEPPTLVGVAGMTPVEFLYETIQQMGLPNANLYRGNPEGEVKQGNR